MNSFGRIRRIIIIVYLTIILLPFFSFAQADDYIKSYITVKEGLSQNEVTSIAKDKNGFMWFGTRGGLNRYDSYNFKIFKPNRNSQTSILNPSVECLYFDKSMNAWIGTKSGGISVYDPVSETFEHGDSLIPGLPNRVVVIKEDYDSNIWIGSFYGGLLSYEPGTSESHQWFSSLNVQSIVQTPDSTVWVGIADSLMFKKPGEEFNSVSFGIDNFTITEILIDPDNPWLWFSGWGLPLIRFNYQDYSYKYFWLPDNMSRIYSLLYDNSGKIWAGTWGSGLFVFDQEKEEFIKKDIYPDPRFSKVSDYDIILDLYQDEQGLIWVGTDGGGVVILSPTRGFNTVNSFNNGEKYHITSIIREDNGALVAGTREQGLIYSDDYERFRRIGIKGMSGQFAKQNIYSIGETIEGQTWVGMEEGLFFLTENNLGEKELSPVPLVMNPDLPRIMKVLDVQQTGDELWVATQQRGLALFKRKGDDYSFSRMFNSGEETGGINSNRITSIILDNKQNLWAGTYNGVYMYDRELEIFKPLQDLLSGSEKPLCNIVLCSHLDSKNNIWLGTPCGISKIVASSDLNYSLIEFTNEDGLPDDYISNILEDKDGDIWFTSNAGISRFDIKDNSIYNFESGDGTGDYNFSESAGFMSNDGTLYFGGFSGFTHFRPDELIYDFNTPPLAITSFKVMNREVEVDPEGILPVSVNEIQDIVLNHKHKEISIEFAALDYKSPGRNQYQYKLQRKGDEAGWEYLGNRRMVSYQNLKPGDYTLYIKGSNSNGLWNQNSRQLNIKVLPSPWKRGYAFVAYILFILLIIILIIQTSLKQERLKNLVKMEHVQLQQEKQINEYKLRFFTNISHELRTPLSMILAPLNDLLKNENKEISRGAIKKLGLVKNNANRLMKLINQLIEFRKVEVGKVRIEVADQDIISFIKDIIKPFKDLASHKGIDLITEFSVKKASVYFDARKLSVTVNNLINNAIKYCGDPGFVKIRVEETDTEIIMLFINDGKGIPSKDIDNIFERFYQVSSSSYLESSGIGLALVKNYIEMHKGEIIVESTPDGLTKFEIRLKKGRDHFSDNEISTGSALEALIEDFVLENDDEPERKETFRHMGTKGAKILVIDDNKDIRDYLSGLLSDYYRVSLAENGKQGFDKALDVLPDVIISDVMMPEMDGYELCEKIKSHSQLSHIPFVMLTAKDTHSDMIFGARKGADYYLVKPFSPDFILEKIRQIISSRKELVNKYSRKVTLNPEDKEITHYDEKIIKSAIKVIEQNIENDELNLELMADHMAMSSSTLYRKMKAICGQSPGKFIRSIRFKRAAQLLRDSDLAVSEIIEQVGYNSVKQFRENFKTEFGTTPANYRKQFKEDSPKTMQ
ncbi:MAG: response regulator [Bacteroidales bacterium]|nr:response regulator [Bacteroidales bacterium]